MVTTVLFYLSICQQADGQRRDAGRKVKIESKKQAFWREFSSGSSRYISSKCIFTVNGCSRYIWLENSAFVFLHQIDLSFVDCDSYVLWRWRYGWVTMASAHDNYIFGESNRKWVVIEDDCCMTSCALLSIGCQTHHSSFCSQHRSEHNFISETVCFSAIITCRQREYH